MRNKRKALILIALTGILMIVIILTCGKQIRQIVQAGTKESGSSSDTTEPQDPDRVVYYANSEDKLKEAYFGPDRYAAAQAAVEAGEADNIVDYLFKDSGEGDFFTSIYHDPALCAAVGLELDLKGITGDDPILFAEQNLLVGERADAAHLRFLEHYDQWDAAITRIKAILTARDNTWEVAELSDYTSAMYMIKDQLEGDKPGVVVRSTTNAGGHFLVIHVKMADGSIIDARFRLECGYQPVDPNWPVPVEPEPVVDNPEPTPEKEKTPEVEKTREPDPVKSKDPKNGPEQAHDDDDSDDEFRSPDNKNNDPDKTETEEPKSPDTYKSPEKPKTKEPATEQPTTEKPKDKQPEASKDTDSGSKTVDEDNGKHVTTDDGKDAEVTAGDGKDRDDFGEVVDKTPAPVQEPFKDGTTDGKPPVTE